MNDNYRRALSTLLRKIERDVLQLRRSLELPVRGALYEEAGEGDISGSLRAIDLCVERIGAYASQFGLARERVAARWLARVQLLMDEVAIEEMAPERGGRGFGGVGDATEVDQVRTLLAELTDALAAIRDTLGIDKRDVIEGEARRQDGPSRTQRL
ncbi:MAG: hypothetical protein ACYC9X_13925 [Dehalococcoidia bacterium]